MTDFNYTPPFEYSNGWRDIVNTITQNVDERAPANGLSIVWSTDSPFTIPSGGTITLVVRFNDPVTDAVTPTAAQDLVWSGLGTVTAALNRDSGQSLSIMLTSTGGAATVSFVQLRARLLPVARTVMVAQDDPTSIGQHGLKAFQGDIPLATINDVMAVEDVILGQYSQRTPIVKLHVQVQDATYLTEILTRTISDRITIVNGELVLSGEFFVENVAHTIFRTNPDKLPVHEVVFGCDQIISSPIQNPFTFDKVGAGFDQGQFAGLVIDDPDTIFIFDHAIQGRFGTGVFAT